ncbi:hypothetical protein, partial [Streptomyces anthocyanicus]|uniref:hypothetical protein n=1 Tax=Streptomyces anthocyanicus TaxID=68174 RepID=UPI00166FC00B
MDDNSGYGNVWGPEDWDPNAPDWREHDFVMPDASWAGSRQGNAAPEAGPDPDAISINWDDYLDLTPEAGPDPDAIPINWDDYLGPAPEARAESQDGRSEAGPPPDYANLARQQQAGLRAAERARAARENRAPA